MTICKETNLIIRTNNIIHQDNLLKKKSGIDKIDQNVMKDKEGNKKATFKNLKAKKKAKIMIQKESSNLYKKFANR